jgi:hypothetical protein
VAEGPKLRRYWRTFQIPMLVTPKQRVLKVLNSNSQFQPSMPTSKRSVSEKDLNNKF